MSYYSSLKNKFSFNFKIQFLKRVMVNCNENEFQHFKIRSLNEISKLQLLFCQQIPLINKFDNQQQQQQQHQQQHQKQSEQHQFEQQLEHQQQQQQQQQEQQINYDYTNNNNSDESSSIKEIIKKIIIDGYGGNSSQLNIVFGLFLNEIGIKVQLVKTIINSNGVIHFSNIIQWKDGNDYFVDVGLNVNSCFQPIELSLANNSNSIVNFNQKEYRVRRLIDGSFVYEQKQMSQFIFQPICHFNRNLILSNDQLISILNGQNIINNKYLLSSQSSSSLSLSSIPSLCLFKLFDKGYYLFENDSFYIVYFDNSKKDREILLKDFTSLLSTPSVCNYVNLENSYYTKQFLNKYFNILK
ncbi:hypothetical protein ACTA71_000069 [Dictyostelium dimigraforme]